MITITILCHNWQLNGHRLAQKVLLTLILGEKKNVFKFTSNIMLSFTNSQYQWRTMQTGHWDSAKGDHDHLKEVKITVNKG